MELAVKCQREPFGLLYKHELVSVKPEWRTDYSEIAKLRIVEKSIGLA